MRGLQSTGVLVAAWLALAPHAMSAEPLLLRHRVATIAASDLRAVSRDYARWLGYRVRERGRVSSALAASWDAPAAAGQRYILMSPDAAPDVYIRAVQSPAVRGYRPITSYGWNAIEIIVDDPDALRAQLRDSPFKVIGEPAPLGSYPTIRAFQVEGPHAEVLYLTAETGDRSRSLLPPPGGTVGRVFIMVVAGPDIDALLDWYASHFGMARGTARQLSVGVVQRAQGLAPGATVPLATQRLAQPGNLIEFDGYQGQTGARSTPPGQLPPGIASASFTVHQLDAIDLPFIRPPARYPGKAYAGHRSATVRGPAGELVELIEE
jgi:catechol 2,3-dioxygenase-like lactoylglutathione lyase family enzyme